MSLPLPHYFVAVKNRRRIKGTIRMVNMSWITHSCNPSVDIGPQWREITQLKRTDHTTGTPVVLSHSKATRNLQHVATYMQVCVCVTKGAHLRSRMYNMCKGLASVDKYVWLVLRQGVQQQTELQLHGDVSPNGTQSNKPPRCSPGASTLRGHSASVFQI